MIMKMCATCTGQFYLAAKMYEICQQIHRSREICVVCGSEIAMSNDLVHICILREKL